MKKILVVGAGLAGSCVSYQLAEQGFEVELLDSSTNVCTRVSGGSINPLVFRRMTKSWRVDEFLPYGKQFYKSAEQLAHRQLMFPVQIRRFFASEQERNYWLKRQETSEYSSYMHPITEEDETIVPYANTFGSGRVKEGYYLDVDNLLQALQSHPQITVKKERMEYDLLDPVTAQYANQQYDFVVFCEGYEIKNNPWFNHLAIDPTKGEVLSVQVEGLSTSESFNRKCFTFYIGDNTYKIGATYDWHTDDTTLTETGKLLLLDNLKSLTPHPATVVGQEAGVRPTTKDRRPYIGKHPKFDRLVVFNGLGAKGFMIAPLLSLELVHHLLKGTDLDKECVFSETKRLKEHFS